MWEAALPGTLPLLELSHSSVGAFKTSLISSLSERSFCSVFLKLEENIKDLTARSITSQIAWRYCPIYHIFLWAF